VLGQASCSCKLAPSSLSVSLIQVVDVAGEEERVGKKV